jgi:hypothetical protein
LDLYQDVAGPGPLAHPKCSANIQENDMTENIIPEIPQAVGMRSVAQSLWRMPAFGVAAETIAYLLFVLMAVIAIKATVSTLVTESGNILMEPAVQLFESKPQVKVR